MSRSIRQKPEWIAVRARAFRMVGKAEKAAGIHDRTSMHSVNHNSTFKTRCLRVSSHDNALAESVIGLFRTGVIGFFGP